MIKPSALLSTRDSRLRRLYDAAANTWQGGIERLGFPAAYADFMDRAAPPAGGGVILDIGTGTGAFAEAWAARSGPGDRLDLLDISAPMLAVARERLARAATRVETIHAAIGAQCVPAGTYDTVLCAHVIEHIPDPAEAISWIAGRLRPGGHLLLAVSRPHWCTTLVRLRWGNASIRPEMVVRLLSAAGFAKVEIKPFSSGPPQRTSCGYVAMREEVATEANPEAG
jgi:2-polyprenyl-3-methyl-5-hydroxy-6-metoxy-1,4-benzoquinol methylase